MNKDKINSKIEDLEAELQKLKQLANEPERRAPEAGDVWLENDGTKHIVVKCSDGLASAMFEIGECDGALYSGSTFSSDPFSGILRSNFTYLGKFDEVYVKISDVRDAVISYSHQGSTVMSTEALCDLNIITAGIIL
tara:strand:+ start:3550 stop:3960 length:411 start_codon:yes stop_codon:yes gene_type:complete